LDELVLLFLFRVAMFARRRALHKSHLRMKESHQECIARKSQRAQSYLELCKVVREKLILLKRKGTTRFYRS